MKVDKGLKRIMNLDPILELWKAGALHVEICGSNEKAKFGSPVTIVTAHRDKFKKIISYSILIGIISFLHSN